MKFKSKKIIIISVILIIIIGFFIFLWMVLTDNNKNPYGDRCDERINYLITDKKMKSVEKKFKEIEQVNSVEVYTKLCTIKIIVNLKEDIDIENIKAKATEVLEIFDEDELGLYDFALYVTSDNKDSEVYPINVSKHATRDNFAW